MTDKNSAPSPASAVDDTKPYEFQYDHGRMPFFLKVVWVAFLAMATWYIVTYLLTALGTELGT